LHPLIAINGNKEREDSGYTDACPFGRGWGTAAARLLRPLFIGHRGVAGGAWCAAHHILL